MASTHFSTKHFLVLCITCCVNPKTMMRMKAFLKAWLAIGYTAALLCIQFYEGEVLRGFVTLLIMGIILMSRIVVSIGGGLPVTKREKLPRFISKVMIYLWYLWLIINLPSVFPFLLLTFSAPPVIQVAFILFFVTWLVCVVLYYEFEDRRKEREIQGDMVTAQELSYHVKDMLKKAQTRQLDISDCKEMIEKAEKFMNIGEDRFREKDYINAEICVQSAIDVYQEVITCLTKLVR
ncbi:MAG: hypothetical protein AYK19_07710 [Theionarchaea archaeon DG-70-1]|nr:MAG: hypothetical protein AYK19_07710 [Theionarchaea archaeon DG-70-1]